jgi:hypothetical protein
MYRDGDVTLAVSNCSESRLRRELNCWEIVTPLRDGTGQPLNLVVVRGQSEKGKYGADQGSVSGDETWTRATGSWAQPRQGECESSRVESRGGEIESGRDAERRGGGRRPGSGMPGLPLEGKPTWRIGFSTSWLAVEWTGRSSPRADFVS